MRNQTGIRGSLHPASGLEDPAVGPVEAPIDEYQAESQSAYRPGRQLAVKVGTLAFRLLGPGLRKWRSFRWAAELHANARQVGPNVYVYGPIRFLGTRNVELGGSGNLYDNVLFETGNAGGIRIGDNFRINRGCLFSARARITLGDGCLIGEYVSIRDNNHVFEDLSRPIGAQGFRAAPIRLGDDVWVGRGAVILQGVTIGHGSVIAANSVVTKDVPAMEVWAGIPAKFLRRRGENKQP